MGMLNPWTSFVKSFILFATDEQGNFMGTWERNPFTQDSQDCPQSSESKYMIIPCGGVSKYEPHVQKHKFKILLTFFLLQRKHNYFCFSSRFQMLYYMHVTILRMDPFGQRSFKVIYVKLIWVFIVHVH